MAEPYVFVLLQVHLAAALRQGYVLRSEVLIPLIGGVYVCHVVLDTVPHIFDALLREESAIDEVFRVGRVRHQPHLASHLVVADGEVYRVKHHLVHKFLRFIVDPHLEFGDGLEGGGVDTHGSLDAAKEDAATRALVHYVVARLLKVGVEAEAFNLVYKFGQHRHLGIDEGVPCEKDRAIVIVGAVNERSRYGEGFRRAATSKHQLIARTPSLE